MRPILGFAALLAWLSHCPDLPEGSDPPQHPAQDAGEDAAEPIEDAAVSGDCDTGELELYQPGFCDERHLAEGIERYEPRFPLWSDGAAKDRYVYLPEGSTIDTSNPDRWTFPTGTRLYKTFSVDGKRIETRVLEKTKDGVGMTAWEPRVYLWSDDQRSAILWTDTQIEKGEPNWLDTRHDVPSKKDCEGCHTMKVTDLTTGTAVDGDAVNGFSAIQLNWTPPEASDRPVPLTLEALVARQRLRNGAVGAVNLRAGTAQLPGDEVEQNALGYLHANCGHCHGGASPRAGLNLWAPVNVQSVADMPAVKTACGVCLARWYNKPNKEIGGDPPQPYVVRLVPGDAAASGIVGRMAAAFPIDDLVNNPMHLRGLRVLADQMPKVGTEFVDETGLQQVRDWIDGMAPDTCKLPTTACPPPPPQAPMMTASTPAPMP